MSEDHESDIGDLDWQLRTIHMEMAGDEEMEDEFDWLKNRTLLIGGFQSNSVLIMLL